MLVGISALTTIGLRRYYAEQADLPAAARGLRRAAAAATAFTRPARGRPGIAQEHTVFAGAAVCAVVAGRAGAGAVPRRSHPGRHRRSALRGLRLRSTVRERRRSTTCSPPTRRTPTDFEHGGFDGVAHAGVAIVTCMDSRIDPLGMLGLQPRRRQDLPQPRRPGHRRRRWRRWCSASTCSASTGSWSSRTPAARWPPPPRRSSSERVGASAGRTPPGSFHVVEDQLAALAEDVRRVRTHPLIPETVGVGGFIYDVDTGLIAQRC